MSRIYVDNAQSVGNTPLVQINRLGPKGVTILAKLEARNPAGSVKCRSLGGELRLHSRPQSGWALCLNIPLEATS